MNIFEQALTAYLGPDNLALIQRYHVGIAGAGGLGSNCAFNLVRSGFKRLTLVDFDRVELSNLNRQFYFLDQVGQYKVEALKNNLLRINPDLEITAHVVRVDAANVLSLFSPCDIIVEAFDKVEAKTLLVETFLSSEKLLVAASGLAGWGNSDEIKTRKIKENFYLVGDGKRDVAEGHPPLSPRVNIAAAKEADLVLAWVLGKISCEKGGSLCEKC
jgi:sulfur carrier protein ThiS adenylyltransferase